MSARQRTGLLIVAVVLLVLGLGLRLVGDSAGVTLGGPHAGTLLNALVAGSLVGVVLLLATEARS